MSGTGHVRPVLHPAPIGFDASCGLQLTGIQSGKRTAPIPSLFGDYSGITSSSIPNFPCKAYMKEASGSLEVIKTLPGD